jgi:hypothetical protein
MTAAVPRPKMVHLNDAVIGEVRSWAEVHKLLKAKRIALAGKPNMVEGPTGFHIKGTFDVANSTAGDVT